MTRCQLVFLLKLFRFFVAGAIKRFKINPRFYVALDHFNDLLKNLYNNNLEDFVAGEFPKLSLGVGDSIFHPLIHIGYGYSVKSPKIVVEGMAYLHINYYELKLTSTSAENFGTCYT